MAEDERPDKTADKIDELINLNLGLKKLFKDLIETVGKRLDSVNNSIKSLENSFNKFESLENKLLSIEDSISNWQNQTIKKQPKPIEKTPTIKKEEVIEDTTKIEKELTSRRINFDRPGRGPIDEIYKQLYNLVNSPISGEDLAAKFEEARDKLMEHHSFHPVYHEMARVVNTLKKYKEDKLNPKDIKELETQIDNWRDRMLE
jgi:uncharacterized protein Yka (UPF0111/DUF47 family)